MCFYALMFLRDDFSSVRFDPTFTRDFGAYLMSRAFDDPDSPSVAEMAAFEGLTFAQVFQNFTAWREDRDALERAHFRQNLRAAIALLPKASWEQRL